MSGHQTDHCLVITASRRDVTLERLQQRGAADEWRPSIVWCWPARDRRGAGPRGDFFVVWAAGQCVSGERTTLRYITQRTPLEIGVHWWSEEV